MGIYHRFTTGHQLANYGNYVPWGLWVAVYIYCIGLSAGAFVMSSIIYVGKVKLLEPLAPYALFMAVTTLIMALLSITMDLGHIERVMEVSLHANFRSMMAWMIFLYGAYMNVIIAENILAWVPRLQPYRGEFSFKGFLALFLCRIPVGLAERWLHRLGTIGVPLAIAFHGGVGALFATVGARPYWHQGLFPIIFLVGALVSGSALIAFVFYIIWPTRDEHFHQVMDVFGKMVLGLLLFDMLLEWAEFSIPLWQGISHEADIFYALMYGPYWWNFWIVHLLLGTFTPLVLLLVGRSKPWVVALAGMLIAVTFLSVRINLVVPPLTQPLIEGIADSFVSPRASYSYVPSIFELQIAAFVLAVGTGMMAFAYYFLPILPDPRFDEWMAKHGHEHGLHGYEAPAAVAETAPTVPATEESA